MPTLEYHRPQSLAEAFLLKAEAPEARFVAGGTDVLPHLGKPGTCPPALISLRRVHELDGIAVAPEGARLGGLTRVADVVAHAELARRFPALVQAARRLGSVQIRNVATVGGNLCNASPCADLAPPLLAYDALLRIESPRGARELAMAELFVSKGTTRLAPDEILTAIVLPAPPPGAAARFEKISRVRMDLALVSAAVLLVLVGGRYARARVAMGSVAPRPVRLAGVEGFLEGRPVSDDAARQAGALAREEVTPIDDLRTTAAYRRHVSGVLVERAVRDLAGGAP